MRWILALVLALAVNTLLFLGMQQMISPAKGPIQRVEAQIIDYIKVNPQAANPTKPKTATPLPPPPQIQVAEVESQSIETLSDNVPAPPTKIKLPKLVIEQPKISIPKPYLGAVEKQPIQKVQAAPRQKPKIEPKIKPQPIKVLKAVPSQKVITEPVKTLPAQVVPDLIKTEPVKDSSAAIGLNFVSAQDLVVLRRNKPRYPRHLKRRRVQGYVLVEFKINTVGEVENPMIIESQPAGAFDKSVLRSIRGWKFQPKKQNGQAISIKTRQRIEFKLKR